MSKIRLYGSTSGYTELVPPAAAADNAITLPNTVGEAVVKDSSGNIRVNSINSGPLAGFRNAIINGNFDVWQRGTSSSASGYVAADRWLNSFGGSACTMSRQDFTLGQTDVPGEPKAFCRMVVGSVAGASNYSNLAQRIEDVRTFAGQQVTFSFWAKADASKPIAVELVQYFGTGGSPSASVTGIGATKTTLSTSWQKITVTTTLPSISGKTLGSDGNDALRLFIWFDAGSSFNSRTGTLGQQSGTFDIAQVQVEAGPVATPFERRPIGTELALCQRYYETGKFFHVTGYVTPSFTNSGSSVFFKVEKRTAPVVTQANISTVGSPSVTPGQASINTHSFLSFRTSPVIGAGQWEESWTASAEL